MIELNIEKRDVSCYSAFKAAKKEMIPFGKSGLLFIDNSQIFGNFRVIIESIYADLSKTNPQMGKNPIIFEGNHDPGILKTWFGDPKNRDNDICILGTQNRYNGVETEVVVHVYPKDCPSCGKSDADPVIISRATAMLILSTYQRLSCRCGFELISSSMANYEDPNGVENSLINEETLSLNLQADDRYPLIAFTGRSFGRLSRGIYSCQNFMTKATSTIFIFLLGLLALILDAGVSFAVRSSVVTRVIKAIFWLAVFVYLCIYIPLQLYCNAKHHLIVSNVDICHYYSSGEYRAIKCYVIVLSSW